MYKKIAVSAGLLLSIIVGSISTSSALSISEASSPSTPFTLTKDIPVTIPSLTKSSALYFSFSVPAGATKVSVTTTGDTGDADIYLNRNKVRNSKVSTWKSMKLSSNERITINSPTAGNYFLTLIAYSATTNTTVTVSYTMPNGSGGVSNTSGEGAIPKNTSTPNTSTTYTASTSYITNPVVAVCSYAAAPGSCTYVEGSAYNTLTGCGLVLSCPTTVINTPSTPSPTSPVSVPSSSQVYTFCSNEYSMCNFSGQATVRYGIEGKYVTRTLTGPIMCGNEVFGDPAVTFAKKCHIVGSATITPTPVVTPTVTTGQGLLGSYFTNTTLTGTPSLTRTEAVDFNWVQGSPSPSIPTDNFSARWTGNLLVPTTGTYEFQTISDDGVRLFVNNQALINKWTTQWEVSHTSAGVTLTEGQSLPTVLEYFEQTGEAVIRLLWKTPGTTSFTAIPASRLLGGSVAIPAAPVLSTPTPAPTPTPVNGTCGQANNQTLASIPTTNLCSSGTASSVTNSSSYTWSCSGTNGGAQSSCSAGKQVVSTPTPAPTPTNASGISYPFGSHIQAYVAGIKPTTSSQATQDALIKRQYDYWRSGIQARCGGYIVPFYDGSATVSEGAGYGMLLAVVMAGHDAGARDLFDGLFKVVRSHPAYGLGENALMEWKISGDCGSGGGGWNAMDGDLDIAMALLMADKQWGSSGTVNYKKEALDTIAAMKKWNFSPDGTTRGGPVTHLSRTSDYMITHFKAFRRATNDPFWDTATNRSFDLLNHAQTNLAPNTKLIPDFLIYTDTANPQADTLQIGDGSPNAGDYFWNACRIPWRLASDYVTSGDERSKVVTGKLMDFFNSASGGQPDKIQAGYKLNGTGLSSYVSSAFIGPATAGAMVDTRFQTYLNDLWTFSTNNLAQGYYGTELQLLSLIVVTGNWWNP